MRSIRLLGAVFCAWALSTACGGDEGGDGGNDGGGGGSGGSSSGLPAGVRVVASNAAVPRAGECMSSADCPGAGAACVQVASGYRVCTSVPPQATMPSANPTLDQCDASRACEVGGCFNVQVFESGICGATPPRVFNVCRNNECTSDAECSGGICGPAGFSATESYSGGAVRQCIPASCRSNADCTELAGGVCAVVQAGCDLATTGGAQDYLPAQMACVYPNGCTSLSDCPGAAVCKVISGEAVCVTQG